MILIWILTIGLALLGLLCVIGNLSIPIGYHYQRRVLKTEPRYVSMIPFIGGFSLAGAVMLYPAELPINRVAIALAALCLDISMLMLPYLLFMIIKGVSTCLRR